MNQSYREVLKGGLIRNDAGEEDYLGFQNRCVRKFGPAAGIFVRQLVYWTGKQHDPNGWIYKSQAEMEQETGLSRRHQEKARDILLSHGVIEVELGGLPRRLWYRVDLEALLDIMRTPYSTLNQWARKHGNGDATKTTDEGNSSSQDGITEHTDESDSTAQASRNGNTHPASEDDNSAPTSEDSINGRAITESTSQTTPESSSDKSSTGKLRLQRGESRASRGLSPIGDVNMNNLQKSSIDNFELNRIYYLLVDIPGSEAYRALERHREGSLSLQDLAGEVCFALTGSRDHTESYVEPVRHMVDELALDDDVSY